MSRSSVLQILSAPLEQEPSASNNPATNPFVQSSSGRCGQPISVRHRSTASLRLVAIAPIRRWRALSALYSKALVWTPEANRKPRVRSSASASASAKRIRWTRRLPPSPYSSPERAVPPEHPADVALPVRARVARDRARCAHTDQAVVRCQMGSTRAALLAPRYVLPAAIGEEAVVTTGNELRSVGEGDAEGLLLRAPVGEDLRLHVAPVATRLPGAVDLVAHGEVGDRCVVSIGPHDEGVRRHAEGAAMAASSVRVDRVAEVHVGHRRHVVDRRAGVDLGEFDAERLWGVESAGDGAPLIPGSRPSSSRSAVRLSHRTNVCSQGRQTIPASRSQATVRSMPSASSTTGSQPSSSPRVSIP